MQPADLDEVSKLLDDQINDQINEQANERARLMRRAEKAEERAKENEADCWCVSVSFCILLFWLLILYSVGYRVEF